MNSSFTQIFLVTPVRHGVGLTSAALGIVRALQRLGVEVGFVKPIAQEQEDNSDHFAREILQIPVPAALALADSAERIAANQTSQLLEDVVALCMKASTGAGVLVVEGLHTDAEHPFASQLNVDLARSLNAEVVLVADASLPQAVTESRLAASQFANADCRVAGVIFNKAPAHFDRAAAQNKLGQIRIWGMVPENPMLRAPRTLDIAQHLGKREAIAMVAAAQGITRPAGLEILDPDAIRGNYVDAMVTLRKTKGLTPTQALEQLEDVVVVGTMMLAVGEVDGLVSGVVHTTANTVRPAMQLIKTAPGASIVSSVFFMLMPDQVLVYGDCAINPDPTADQLAEIAKQSADSAAAFGITPKVAMISYSTGLSGTGDDVNKVRMVAAIAHAKYPALVLDGPLQYDAASVADVGRQKAPNSPVAGQATVFLFPDLNTGNTTYKAVQRSANVVSVGPMLQGLRKPVNDLSRGALVDDIVFTIALTAIQAQYRAGV